MPLNDLSRSTMLQKMIDLARTDEDVELVKDTVLSLAIQGVLTGEHGTKPDWPKARFSEIAEFRAGRTPARQEIKFWRPEVYNWVSIADLVHDGEVVSTKERISEEAKTEVFKSDPAPAGTLLMSFKLTIGKISVLGVDAFFNEAIISIEPKEMVSKDYLVLALPAIARGGDSRNAIKGKTLNRDSLGRLEIPIPSAQEQAEIVATVRRFFAELDDFKEHLLSRESARQIALKGLAQNIIAESSETPAEEED